MSNDNLPETTPLGAGPDAATAAFPTPSAAPAHEFTQPSAPAPAPASAPAPAPTSTKNPPLFATIFWGVLLIAFAGFVFVWAALDIAPDPVLWGIITVIGAGLILLVAGIAASLRRAG